MSKYDFVLYGGRGAHWVLMWHLTREGIYLSFMPDYAQKCRTRSLIMVPIEFWRNSDLFKKKEHFFLAQKLVKGKFVVGDEKTSASVVLNNNLWLEINKNTSSNERMPARHRSLWRDWLCSLQFVSVLYSSHKYPQSNNGYGSFFATYNMVHCSLLKMVKKAKLLDV